ncbi:DMT family transporter [Aliikangiella coralliicola]|uniref:EamA family transporter n=1 Tax=Aliikangiella coralliicola TaxID=2592383 RepID=A0A545UFG2_9GAMM|nr:DMT family transporter [Aliikangiella coralliicola]TQV88185.1 EamA family transporter [Aliikangiella coralliicola]
MSNTTGSIKSLLLIALASILLMSFVPVLIKWISANAVTIGIVRLTIGAAGIGVLVLFSKKRASVTRRDFIWLFLLGLFFAVHWYTYFQSIKMSDASLAAIGMATFGIHLLLLNRIFFKETINISDYFAIVISFIGIYIASPRTDIAADKLNGFLLSVFSGFVYACLPLINRRITRLSTNTRALGQFGFALLFFMLLLPQSDFNLSSYDWGGLVVLGVLSTLIAHTLWIKASTELPTKFTAVLYYCYVPIAILLSFIFLNETMNWQKLVGAGLIIAANIMVVFLHKTAPAR